MDVPQWPTTADTWSLRVCKTFPTVVSGSIVSGRNTCTAQLATRFCRAVGVLCLMSAHYATKFRFCTSDCNARDDAPLSRVAAPSHRSANANFASARSRSDPRDANSPSHLRKSWEHNMVVCGPSMLAHIVHIFVSDCTDRELVLPLGMALPRHVPCTVIAYVPGNLCQPRFGAEDLSILSTGSLFRFWIQL
jgi:hypothetical protein